jgi:hypothetical protein
MYTLPEEFKIVNALAPAADAGGRTGAYVSLKGVKTAFVVFHMTQGNAATIALSINQATSIAGGSATPITKVVPIWANLDTAASDALVRATDAVNYTTDAGVKLKQVIFQIDPAMLNQAGGFDCIVAITGASNAANITACQYFLESRYPQATPPSAVVD